MKRIISLLLCLVLMTALAAPVSAASPEVIFTADSGFTPGCTVTVDEIATGESIFDNGSDSELEAYLEGHIQYYWMRNDSYYADGTSITIREEDRGCQFYCIGAMYSDDDHTQQFGTIYSAKFSVPNTIDPPTYPEITTTELPNAVVGQEYYFQLECTDPDVHYSLFRSSLPDGMYLTQHGEIEGTPTEAGMWYVVIMATPEAGADYATTAEFEFYVVEDGPDYTLEIMRLPDKLSYYLGESFDMTGAWVRICTPEGYLDSFDGEYLDYFQGPLENLGERRIKLRYMDAMEIIYINVVENPNPPVTHTVYFCFGDSPIASQDVIHGQCAVEPEPPYMDGLAFDGWYTADGELYDFETPVTGELWLYAKFGYVITFHFGDSPIGWQVIEPGQCAIEPEDPGREDMAFAGWVTADGTLYDFSAPVYGDVNLYATWKPLNPFTDVPAGSWFEAPVLWALENGITEGTSATTFAPGDKCLRAHVVTFLWKAEKSPEPSAYTKSFKDVPSGAWYYKPVHWAVEHGITSGTSDTTFGAADVCSRYQVVYFLWAAAGKPEPKTTHNPFTDVKTSHFFYKAVLWAVENGITSGTSATTFSPTSPCNRAQVVTFLYKAYN